MCGILALIPLVGVFGIFIDWKRKRQCLSKMLSSFLILMFFPPSNSSSMPESGSQSASFKSKLHCLSLPSSIMQSQADDSVGVETGFRNRSFWKTILAQTFDGTPKERGNLNHHALRTRTPMPIPHTLYRSRTIEFGLEREKTCLTLAFTYPYPLPFFARACASILSETRQP